jgi:hypothetical protein
MEDESGVGDVDAGVQELPQRGAEVPEPEVVTCRGQQEEDQEGERAERLEGQIGEPTGRSR